MRITPNAHPHQQQQSMAEKHELTEVQQNVEALRESADKVRAKMKCRVTCVPAPAGTTEPPEGAKLIHFIRHGEGFHNVAQREWRADPNWDGTSEPYTKQTARGVVLGT